MSTRGLLGFVINGQEKVAYNHSDSYPDGLGTDVLKWLRDADLKQAAELARQLRVVESKSTPTDEDIERLRPFAHVGVGSGDLRDWYVLLRHTQGDPGAILAAGVIENGRRFADDSLFCEWGYVVDFDRAVFQVFEGFQCQPHDDGRFASPVDNRGYYPIRLIAEWSLERLPDDDAFVKQVDPPEDDE